MKFVCLTFGLILAGTAALAQTPTAAALPPAPITADSKAPVIHTKDTTKHQPARPNTRPLRHC